MPAARGSRHILKAIKEVTFGSTPATPTMIELPVNSYNPQVAIGLIRSGQIRSHPFVDRLMKGAQTNDIDIGFELQDDTHDLLFELAAGAAWSSNVVKWTDALVGMTLESGHTDLTLFDQFAGTCIRRAEFNFPAQPDGVVTVSMGLMAKTGTLDAGATLASSTTAAPDSDPFTFGEASVTIAGASRPVTALSFSIERTIDPLWVLGSFTPREYIPSDVVLTGQITIPLEDATESARLTGFTAAEIVASCVKGANSRVFTIPKVHYASMGRRKENRGVILQEINFEAKYDSALASVMSITRSA